MLTQHGFDCLTDWRIVARPPLVIDNQLPVSSQFALWERQQRGGALVLRQQGRLEGGGRARIYSVDMRHQVRAPAAPRPGGPSAPPSPGVPASAVGARLLRPHACRGCCKEAAAQPALKSTLRALCTAPLPPAPRLQVLLTIVPDGCEWAERAPVLVSRGFLSADSGVGEAAAQLPSTFNVRGALTPGSSPPPSLLATPYFPLRGGGSGLAALAAV